MPLFDDYREQLKSEIADMVNSPGRPAGAITAAMFLKEFSRRHAVGAPRHRRHGLGGRGAGVDAEGRHRRDDPHAGRAARGARARTGRSGV